MSSWRRPWWPVWPAPGVDVIRLGHRADARASRSSPLDSGADLGVMLSASHNPMPDNGIKFFARGGTKLDDALEDAIESRMRRALGPPHRRRASAG